MPNLLHCSDKFWASLIWSASALKITLRSRERKTLHFHCADSLNLLGMHTYGGNVCLGVWNPSNHGNCLSLPLVSPAHCWHTCNTRDHLGSPGCQGGTRPGTSHASASVHPPNNTVHFLFSNRWENRGYKTLLIIQLCSVSVRADTSFLWCPHA